MTKYDYQKKMKIVGGFLDKHKAQGLLIISKANKTWLLDSQLSFTLCLATKNKTFLFINRRDIDTYKENTTFASIVLFTNIDDVIKVIKQNNIKHLLFEKEMVTFQQYEEYLQPLCSKIRVTPIISKDLSVVKLPYELKYMQKAANIVCVTMRYIRKIIKPRMTELQVKSIILQKMFELGADNFAFDPIVAFGENSAEPHHKSTERKLKLNEFIKIDIGCTYKGYNSDLTRTFWLGAPTKQMVEIYKIVLAANKLGIKLVQTNKTGYEIDLMVRKFIYTHSKYGDRFIHALGHRLGLAGIKESRFEKNDKVPLFPNSTITIEPGIYVPNLGGVRIEDDVVVTQHGRFVLTKMAPKEI
ncbi:MAG: M24 family metallopeptidase [Mycoplasmataceae bacterium]|jgi:Xaa-Pro aminopeptidase|nr:M24 family metallopeptidase [Mycoplasmataceae bacterium]